MLSKYKLNQLYFKDTQFANLMTRRIFNVLLIANPYEAFMLEDDGRIDEKIFNEYTSLSLRYPPRFSQVSSDAAGIMLILGFLLIPVSVIAAEYPVLQKEPDENLRSVS